ncbi:MAG: hypothetical protein ACRD8O_09810 [Bryobacteraceae bacterium]
MISQRKLASSRANGAKSRGPVTPEGRAKSSMNALKHGLTAETLVVDGENPDELPGLIAMTVDYFQPQNDFETELVLELAAIRWRLRRVPKIETGLFDKRQAFAQIFVTDYAEVSGQQRLGEIYHGIEESLDLLTRYETRLQRRYNQALANLLKLRAAAAKPAPTPAPPDQKENALIEPNPKSGHQDVVHPPDGPRYRPSSALLRALIHSTTRPEEPNDV